MTELPAAATPDDAREAAASAADGGPAPDWRRAIDHARLVAEGRTVVRFGRKQIALFATLKGVFACDNRCPHEGYPLREGALDATCVLTCNWHNWKFDLASGANLYGGDRLRVYPVRLDQDAVFVDLAEPPFATRRAAVLAALREAFDDHAYDRIAREIARLAAIGADPAEAVVAAIQWSHERFEFGWTHAFAGAADWLALHDRIAADDTERLASLIEAVGHIADDALRQPLYAYDAEPAAFDEDAYLAAVEAEDGPRALALMAGAVADGLPFAAVEPALARAALAHYADFGHALIYLDKAGALIARLGEAVAGPLLMSLTRTLVFARREDLIPEFRHYASALAAWGGAGAAPRAETLRGRSIRDALFVTAANGGAAPEAIYRALLAAAAANMLAFDLRFQERTDGPLADNAGWLDMTHGLTFAAAVRATCTRHPELWPAGLLQMACFAGRNAPYTDPGLDPARWCVADPIGFLDAAIAGLFDHGRDEYIVSVHVLKTLLAARAEAAHAEPETAGTIAAALNRFVHTPLKRKHVRRTAHQALAFVALDG